jgi:signal transduction histidine kinase
VQAPAAIGMTTGADHRIVFINPPYLLLLGRPNEDVLGKPFSEVVPEVTEQGIFRLLDDVYRTGDPYIGREMKLRLNRSATGQPSLGYFNFVLQPARDVNGEVEGILIHVQEVTDQVTARHEVERRERLLEVAQSAANAGSFEWNIETGEFLWTENYYEVHAVPRSITPSYENWKKLLHPDDVEKAEARIQETMAAGREILESEYRIKTPDGSPRWILTHGRFFYDDAGKPLRLVGISIDVTQRKRSEDAMRRSEKLAATGRLAASIAHEINNPLEAVTNLLFLISSSDGLNDSSQAYLEMAQRELSRVGEIATQTLRFYRQSTGARQTRVAELMDSVLGVYQGRLQSANVKVVREYGEVRDLNCMAGEIRQVLANLVGNALDAMGPGGKLRLRIRESQNWQHPEEKGVRITVADTGSGIAPQVRSHMFEPFVTTKESTGTGLGLWVSSEIVNKHSGRIRVHSSTHHGRSGSVFTLFLPHDVKIQSIPSALSA